MGKPGSWKEEVSRSERKFEKKLKFYSRVRDSVAAWIGKKSITKKKNRSRKKKLKAYDLSSLAEVLPELKSSQQKAAPVEVKLNNKIRHNLVLKESNQLKAVINHPAFQSDPVGAIYQHLQRTQPVPDEKPKSKDKKIGKHKMKRKKSGGQQSMEI